MSGEQTCGVGVADDVGEGAGVEVILTVVAGTRVAVASGTPDGVTAELVGGGCSMDGIDSEQAASTQTRKMDVRMRRYLGVRSVCEQERPGYAMESPINGIAVGDNLASA